MKKAFFSMAFLSLMCAGSVYSMDTMTEGAMVEPMVQSAPATLEVEVEEAVTPVDEGVMKIENFDEPTDFVAPVDAE